MTREARPKEGRAQARNGRREQRPSFQFYPRDFLSSPKVRRMSCAERGAYITLLCDQWLEGPLEGDLGTLAARCSVPEEVFEAYWVGALAACFEVAEDGRVFNARLERERAVADDHGDRQRLLGQYGAAKRLGRVPEGVSFDDWVVGLEAPLSDPQAPLKGRSAPTPPHPTPSLPIPESVSARAKGSPLARALKKSLEPLPPEVLAAARAWDDHAREKGNAMTERAWLIQLGDAARDPKAWVAKVEDNLGHNTWTLKPKPPTAANGQRLTARQQDQRRAHDQGKAWEALLEGAIEKGLSAAPAARAVANSSPSSRGAPDAAQAKPGALEAKP